MTKAHIAIHTLAVALQWTAPRPRLCISG